MSSSSSARLPKRRQALRAKGLRPIQIWIPDSRVPGFAEECIRQSFLVAEADRNDPDLLAFLDAALIDLLSGTE